MDVSWVLWHWGCSGRSVGQLCDHSAARDSGTLCVTQLLG